MSRTPAAPQLYSSWSEALERAWHERATLDAVAACYQRRFLIFKFVVLSWQVVSTGLLLLQPALVRVAAQIGIPGAGQAARYAIGWVVSIVANLLVRLEFLNAARQARIPYQAAAEAIEGQIYAYRVGVGAYDRGLAETGGDPPAQLDGQVASIREWPVKWMERLNQLQGLRRFLFQCRAAPPAFSAPDHLLQPLTADEYLVQRVQAQIDEHEAQAARLLARYRRDWLLILFAGALGTFLAAVGLDPWLALTVSLSGALTAWLEARQTERAIVHHNQARTGLKNVRDWWGALLAAEKRDPENVRRLVVVTERLLWSVETSWALEIEEAMAWYEEWKRGGDVT